LLRRTQELAPSESSPIDVAIAGEDTLHSGLLTESLTPKPAYESLHHLIHTQWRTRATLHTDQQATLHFRAFPGHYRATINGKEVARFAVA
jgi:hypothetical protein